jgi:hypothetical protein
MAMKARIGTFQTNSSSAHSFVIGEPNHWPIGDARHSFDWLPEIDEDGMVEVPVGEFGWDWWQTSRTGDKAAYLATHVAQSLDADAFEFSKNGPPNRDREKMMLEEAIVRWLKKCGREAQGIRIVPREGGDVCFRWGYIDHNSCEGDRFDVPKQIFKSKATLDAFLFREGSWLRTGNDNEWPPIALFDRGAKLLYSGTNGNIKWKLHSDGSLVLAWKGMMRPEWPQCIDVKVTNRCGRGCPWCHERSTSRGKHADLDRLREYLAPLPRGTELAIGGGNPMEHPGLEAFLKAQKKAGRVCNLTVHHDHMAANRKTLRKWINRELIHGIGVSMPPGQQEPIDWLQDATDNYVYHVIAGINEPDVTGWLFRLLILGYKFHGRGSIYGSQAGNGINASMDSWRAKVPDLLKCGLIAFDDAAIDQLRIRDAVSAEDWERYYLGGDGELTMYIDAVRARAGASSVSPVRNWANPKTDFARIRRAQHG